MIGGYLVRVPARPAGGCERGRMKPSFPTRNVNIGIHWKKALNYKK